MNKILILIFGLLVLTSCRVDNNTNLRKTSRVFMSGEPKLFEYKGHEYIYFYTPYGDVVHNPDCHCNKEE